MKESNFFFLLHSQSPAQSDVQTRCSLETAICRTSAPETSDIGTIESTPNSPLVSVGFIKRTMSILRATQSAILCFYDPFRAAFVVEIDAASGIAKPSVRTGDGKYGDHPIDEEGRVRQDERSGKSYAAGYYGNDSQIKSRSVREHLQARF